MRSCMKPITDVLPDGWEKKMRELGAFTRVGDYLKTPEDVLRLLLLWGDFGTFGLTAAFLKTTGDFAMSKVAVFQRVQKSEAFLQWLAVSMCREHHFLSLKPSWLCEYRVLLADATKTSRPASRSSSRIWTTTTPINISCRLSSMPKIQRYLYSLTAEATTNSAIPSKTTAIKR